MSFRNDEEQKIFELHQSTEKDNGDTLFDQISDVVHNLLCRNARAGSTTSEKLVTLTRETIEATEAVGANVGKAAGGLIHGTVKSAEKFGSRAADVIEDISAAAISEALLMGIDIVEVADGLLEGAATASKEFAQSSEETIAAVIRGAKFAADNATAKAVREVKHAIENFRSKKSSRRHLSIVYRRKSAS